MKHELQYQTYKRQIERYLAGVVKDREPASLFTPARYVLAGGGKRIRPVLVLLSCTAAHGAAADAIHAAAAVEILHNFTLVHDDIMDNAETRRGRKTVHKQWDINVAILAGDAMLGFSYQALLRSPNGTSGRVAAILTKAYIDICKGQALDKEFELRRHVSVEEYLEMISLKTGRLISAAAEIGATIGHASASELRALVSFGTCLGRAFQIQDDLLDVIADERSFGKVIGGDIVEGKKTFLLLHALEHSTPADRSVLRRVARKDRLERSIVRRVRAIYERTGAIRAAQEFVTRDTRTARRVLQKLDRSPARETLLWLTDRLEKRLF